MSRAVERDTETLIDTQLRNLGWIDTPKVAARNVWKQTAKTPEQREVLGRRQPDYVLYETGTDRPLIVIEAKRQYENLESALSQGADYCRALDAPICFATDGIYTKTKHIDSCKPLFRDGEEIDEFVREALALRYIQAGTNWIETLDKQVIKSRAELIQVFEAANNALRYDGVQSGRDRFSEFANILFLKLISEAEEIREAEGKPPSIDRAFRWDSFRNKHGQELLHFVNDIVLRFFAEKYDDPNIFKPLEIRNATTLKRIIDILDPLNLTDVNSDIKGDAFEYFLRRYISEHNNDLGEYFTPRHIVKTCVKLANPEIGERVYDPFCGTGGMLIEAFRHMHAKMVRNSRNMNTLRADSLFGNEITINFRIAKMNMILMGDGHNNVVRRDSLESLEETRDQYDVVITNMPFGQITEHGDLYDLPTNNGNSICIQHCLKSIDPASENGRIVLICGDDVLVNRNKDYERLRQYMFENSSVHTVISLPPGVFAPYSNTVKTNILYLTDIRKVKEQTQYWYFKVKNDGFTFAQNRKRNPEGENDLDVFLMHRKYADHDRFTTVSLEEIADDGYVMVPFFSNQLDSKNAVYLGDITEESKIKAGSDYEKYAVGTVAARARNAGGLVPKEEYYKKPFQSENRSNYKLVEPGQFVYRKEGADIGTSGWNRHPYPFAVSNIYVVFSIDEERVLHDYLFNVIRSEHFISAAEKLMTGVARATLSYQDFARMQIPLPSIEEQTEIVQLERSIANRVQEIADLKDQIQDHIIGIYANS